MEVQANPEYEGPDIKTFITLAEPDANDLRSIPLNIMVLISFPDGQLGEWYWDQEMLNDSLSHVEEHGPMTGHVFIYVNPDIIKEGH